MYSAKKVGGKKLYKLARQGIVVERKPQIVTISELEIIQYAENILQLRVVCSPGTYIRSLVHAIGADLAVGAYATELVRTRIGTYTLHNAQTLEEIIAQKYT
jgi:tRNA pseudouridine55 synthase